MKHSTNQPGTIHPIMELVNPRHRSTTNLEQIIFILKLSKNGISPREISKRLYSETGKDLSVERVRYIIKRYKEGMKYV